MTVTYRENRTRYFLHFLSSQRFFLLVDKIFLLYNIVFAYAPNREENLNYFV